jgi:XTP/dITP diphosphohydrolase
VTRLLVATTNIAKLREIRRILGDLPMDLLSLRDFAPVPEADETGSTFEENARLKALYYDRLVSGATAVVQCGPIYTVAEDSGLVVDALDGEPGVLSARFLRPDASYPERFEEIFRRLAERPSAPRAARFVSAVAVVHSAAVIYETVGVVSGEIAAAPRGDRGFGYDPIFYYPPYARTLAEATDEEKERVSHRGEAFRRLAKWLARSADPGHRVTKPQRKR